MNKKIYFEDLYEFWNYAFQDSNAIDQESRLDDNIEWTGGLDWEQSKKMAQTGWVEGMKKIERYRVEILPMVAQKILRPFPINSMVGYCVDVGAYLSNQPECFINREYHERNFPGRILKIVCSVSFSASITPETIIQRGAMVCALIDAIEYAGHRTEVIANFASTNDRFIKTNKDKYNSWFEVSVVLKKSHQPLELTDLAFCLAHPAMLRRIMFSVAELNGWSDFAHNYGYPEEATDKGDIYIQEIFSKVVPDSKAIEWVLQQLKVLGINIEEV